MSGAVNTDGWLTYEFTPCELCATMLHCSGALVEWSGKPLCLSCWTQFRGLSGGRFKAWIPGFKLINTTYIDNWTGLE